MDIAPTTTHAAPPPEAMPRAAAPSRPFVSIVVPALNEEAYIEDCLATLVRQWPAEACEILVLDGGSTDGTIAAIERFVKAHPPPAHPPVRILGNPARIQSAAVNLAARLADPRARVIIRADAHATYAPGFVAACFRDLLRTGATSVVVPMRNAARPGQGLQRAVALAQGSRLGNGGAAHRVARRSGFVDHGHHAAFDRDFFLSVGGYDETFTHNEDAEFDHRSHAAGGRVWMCAEAPVTYYPRATLRGLARQYLNHGAGRARTILKHRMRPKPRQMAPLVILLGSAGALAATPLLPAAALLLLPYPLACIAWGGVEAARRRDPALLAAGPALMTMHLGWAVGFLRSVARRGRPRIAAPAQATDRLAATAVAPPR